jgi:hypothetical protein
MAHPWWRRPGRQKPHERLFDGVIGRFFAEPPLIRQTKERKFSNTEEGGSTLHCGRIFGVRRNTDQTIEKAFKATIWWQIDFFSFSGDILFKLPTRSIPH